MSTSDTVLRVVSLCLALAGTETLHGIARSLLLAPRIGKRRAIQVSIVSGSLLAFAVCHLLVPGVGLQTVWQHLLLGVGLAVFMAAFDIALGLLVLRLPMTRVLRDFDPRGGNLLLIGLLALAFFPVLVHWLR